jgi:hypothetical protein
MVAPVTPTCPPRPARPDLPAPTCPPRPARPDLTPPAPAPQGPGTCTSARTGCCPARPHRSSCGPEPRTGTEDSAAVTAGRPADRKPACGTRRYFSAERSGVPQEIQEPRSGWGIERSVRQVRPATRSAASAAGVMATVQDPITPQARPWPRASRPCSIDAAWRAGWAPGAGTMLHRAAHSRHDAPSWPLLRRAVADFKLRGGRVGLMGHTGKLRYGRGTALRVRVRRRPARMVPWR